MTSFEHSTRPGNDIPASAIKRAQYIGRVSKDPFAIWHIGDSTKSTLCGRAWRDTPSLIDRADTYNRDWMCAPCLRREGV